MGARLPRGAYTWPPMKRALLAGAVAVVLAAGCSNPREGGATASEVPVPDFVPPCDQVFVAGNIIDRQTFGDACRTADDDLMVPRPAVVDCTDGRELVWNDLAWGYVGDAMQLFDPNEDEKVPVDEALDCLESSAQPGQGGSPPS
jgi:hypothetical protein